MEKEDDDQEHVFSANVVLCHYDEDVSWSDRWAAIRVVYDKADEHSRGAPLTCPSIALDNNGGRGREGDAFLRHILRLYPHFPDVTVFCQGRVADHCHGLEQWCSQVDEIVAGRQTLVGGGGYLGLSWHWGTVAAFKDPLAAAELHMPIREIWLALFPDRPDVQGDGEGTFTCNYNGMFAVTRGCLLQHGREVYAEMLRLQCEVEPMGYVTERLWTPLFTCVPRVSAESTRQARQTCAAQGSGEVSS